MLSYLNNSPDELDTIILPSDVVAIFPILSFQPISFPSNGCVNPFFQRSFPVLSYLNNSPDELDTIILPSDVVAIFPILSFQPISFPSNGCVNPFFQRSFPVLSYLNNSPDELDTIISLLNTFTVQVANLVPLEFLKVIVTVPAALAVTRPVPLTVATFVLLLVHKVFSVVVEGLTVPVNCTVFPIFNV